jgi:hypothetical protein
MKTITGSFIKMEPPKGDNCIRREYVGSGTFRVLEPGEVAVKREDLENYMKLAGRLAHYDELPIMKFALIEHYDNLEKGIRESIKDQTNEEVTNE